MVSTGAGLFVAGCLIAVVADPNVSEVAGPVGIMVGFLAAGLLFFAGARDLPRDERPTWILLGLGVSAGGVGVLVVAAADALGYQPPAYGPFDAFFAGGYLFVAAGLAKLPQISGNNRQRLRLLLDGLVGAVSAAALFWVLALDKMWQATEGAPFFDRFFGSLYLALDAVLLIVLMLVVVRRGSHHFDVRLILLSASYVALTFGDLGFLLSGAGKLFEEAAPNFGPYLTAVLFVLASGALVGQAPPPREYVDGKMPWWSMALPYSVALSMVGFLSYRVFHTAVDGPDLVLFLATLAVATLVIVRQGLAIQENRSLVERERSALVSSISHELRTPLTSMIGFLELLDADQGELGPEERAEFSGIIRDQAQYMGRIVMDLVLLSREKNAQITLREELVEASSVVNAALQAVGSAAATVAVDLDAGVTLRVDGDRIIQVVANLLTNANRYGGGKTLLRVARDGSDLVVEVHDNGPGVAKKYQAVIWDRFERGSNRFSSTVQGSGIGLAIVAAIVGAHKGRTGYRTSEYLGGACFWAIFPDRIVSSRPHEAHGVTWRVDQDRPGRNLTPRQPQPGRVTAES